MGITKMVALVSLVMLLAAGTAAAQTEAPASPAPDQAAPAGAAAEVKAAKAIENREPVDEGSSFTAGERVWIWSRITGAANTTVKHVWKKDGNEAWSASLPVKSTRWTTYSRRTVQAGQYVVEVQGEDGSVLGSVSFSVQ